MLAEVGGFIGRLSAVGVADELTQLRAAAERSAPSGHREAADEVSAVFEGVRPLEKADR